MFCRNCFYSLQGLESDRCPECGTPFDTENPETWSRTPYRRSVAYFCSVYGAIFATVSLVWCAVIFDLLAFLGFCVMLLTLMTGTLLYLAEHKYYRGITALVVLVLLLLATRIPVYIVYPRPSSTGAWHHGPLWNIIPDR